MAATVLRGTLFAPRKIFSLAFARKIYTSSPVLNERKFDENMLEVLVCPLSKAPLRYDPEKNALICDELAVAYPIKNGIPNLVPSDAEKITIKEKPKT